MTPKIINVISGKGGTGKTLLTAVIAAIISEQTDKKVLVVDLDIFVRGLSTMHYYENGGALSIIPNEKLSVTDFFYPSKCNIPFTADMLGIQSYIFPFHNKPFDILPAVKSIDETYEFQETMPSDIEKACATINQLISLLRQTEYDYIFLDNRAGYDELVAAAYFHSDFSICVEEDDHISRIASRSVNGQLFNAYSKYFLKKNAFSPTKCPAIYIIRNKVRNFSNTYNSEHQDEIYFLGGIPFDADVMHNFGSPVFWNYIFNTMYRTSLGAVWENLATKAKLDTHLPEHESSSKENNNRFDKSLQFFTSTQRTFYTFSLLFLLLSVSFMILGKLQGPDIPKIYDYLTLASAGLGVIISLLTPLNISALFSRNKKDKVKKDSSSN